MAHFSFYSNLTCTCFVLKYSMTYMYIALIRSCSSFVKGGKRMGNQTDTLILCKWEISSSANEYSFSLSLSLSLFFYSLFSGTFFFPFLVSSHSLLSYFSFSLRFHISESKCIGSSVVCNFLHMVFCKSTGLARIWERWRRRRRKRRRRRRRRKRTRRRKKSSVFESHAHCVHRFIQLVAFVAFSWSPILSHSPSLSLSLSLSFVLIYWEFLITRVLPHHPVTIPT